MLEKDYPFGAAICFFRLPASGRAEVIRQADIMFLFIFNPQGRNKWCTVARLFRLEYFRYESD